MFVCLIKLLLVKAIQYTYHHRVVSTLQYLCAFYNKYTLMVDSRHFLFFVSLSFLVTYFVTNKTVSLDEIKPHSVNIIAVITENINKRNKIKACL